MKKFKLLCDTFIHLTNGNKGYTTHGKESKYIQWVLNQPKDKWSNIFESHLLNFYNIIKGEHNDMRISRNVCLMMTSYQSITEFLWGKEESEKLCIDFREILVAIMRNILVEANEELASEIFWQTLEELLAIGAVRIQDDDIQDASTSKAPLRSFIFCCAA